MRPGPGGAVVFSLKLFNDIISNQDVYSLHHISFQDAESFSIDLVLEDETELAGDFAHLISAAGRI